MKQYRYILANKAHTREFALKEFLSGFGITFTTRECAEIEAKKYGLKVYKITIGVSVG